MVNYTEVILAQNDNTYIIWSVSPNGCGVKHFEGQGHAAVMSAMHAVAEVSSLSSSLLTSLNYRNK